MSYKRILVPVDGSPTSNKGLDEAIRLAALQRSRLRLVHIIDESVAFGTAETAASTNLLLDALRRSGKKALDAAEARVRRKGLRPETALLENPAGRIADRIVELAKRWHADLVVMGTHGRSGFDRLLMGSNAELVARHSPVPVLLVPAPAGGAKRARR